MSRIVINVVMALSMTLTGCVMSPITPMDTTKTQLVDFPSPGATTTLGLGETLVAKGTRTTGLALTVSDTTTFGKKQGEGSIWTCGITVPPDSAFMRGVFKTETTEAECFGPFDFQVTLSDGSTNFNCPGRFYVGDVCRDRADESIFVAHNQQKFPLEQAFDNIVIQERVAEHDVNFVQEFIYNGRVGDSLKFIYRELSDSLLRPAFTQEVQYDYSESKTVGFKKLRMEILNATNTEITYRLLSSF